MPWQMVQSNALAEIDGTVVERLPVQVKFQIMFQIYAHVSAGSDRPKG
jgi:hypothetical protein